uniref:Uncharacterized protein n=1 Tax=Arundo donax TaxID=35708 RepID=A0A0A9ABB2_ARUDO
MAQRLPCYFTSVIYLSTLFGFFSHIYSSNYLF